MTLLKDIPELLREEVITEDTAEKLLEYYKKKSAGRPNKLFIIFGVLGSILVGLGIILLIAHNWSSMPKVLKTCFSFLPLLVGQVICGFVLLKKSDSEVWRESSAAFLFFGVGAAISLITQTYNIPGTVATFLLMWMLLGFPLMYIMRSTIIALLFIGGITYYAIEIDDLSFYAKETNYYWLLFILVLPFYYNLFLNNPRSNKIVLLNWIASISVAIGLGVTGEMPEGLIYPFYMCLFGLFYLIGSTIFNWQRKPGKNAFLNLGSVGSIIILLAASSKDFWLSIKSNHYSLNLILDSGNIIVYSIIILLPLLILVYKIRTKSLLSLEPFDPIFLLFIVIFLIGTSSIIAVIFVNTLIFIIGVIIIRKGAMNNQIGVLNYGLLIITILFFCRYFDSNLSFIIIVTGIGFLGANVYMFKKRRLNE